MIREIEWKHLDSANRELARCLETLRKVRASGDTNAIKRAEMAYFQALQWVYEAAVASVSEYARSADDG